MTLAKKERVQPAEEDLSLTPSNVRVARVALLADEWPAEGWCRVARCRNVDVALTQAFAAPQSGTQAAHHAWLLLGRLEKSRSSPGGTHGLRVCPRVLFKQI